ncbi:DUF3577 domain-containing protein [Xanthomonas citri]|nr:DUF3577 domain-containing protein [Xanthomonas citri]
MTTSNEKSFFDLHITGLGYLWCVVQKGSASVATAWMAVLEP